MAEQISSLLLAIGVFLSLIFLQGSNGCQSTEFQCSAGQCIPLHYECDGEGDCPDSSDEMNCQSSRCQPNEFPCGNGRCIPYLYRCDGDNDCGDDSDEECEPFLDNFLIVSNTGRDRDLYQIHLTTGIMLPLKVGNSKLNSVAFDGTRKVVYWTDIDSGMIRKYPLQGSNKTIETIFISSTSGVLEGLALDLPNNKLYYCESNITGQSDGRIGVMSLNGANHRVLLNEPGLPRSIVLDTTNRLMYWTDWGSTPAIVRARMDDGGGRTVLVSSEVKWPNALAINNEEKILYWGDAWFHRIESINLAGTSRRQVVLSETVTNGSYFNFALSPPYLYITDRKQRSVRKLDLRTRQIQNQNPIDVFDRLNGIICYIGNGQVSATSVKSTSIRVRTTRQKRTTRSRRTTTTKPSTMPSSSTTITTSSAIPSTIIHTITTTATTTKTISTTKTPSTIPTTMIPTTKISTTKPTTTTIKTTRTSTTPSLTPSTTVTTTPTIITTKPTSTTAQYTTLSTTTYTSTTTKPSTLTIATAQTSTATRPTSTTAPSTPSTKVTTSTIPSTIKSTTIPTSTATRPTSTTAPSTPSTKVTISTIPSTIKATTIPTSTITKPTSTTAPSTTPNTAITSTSTTTISSTIITTATQTSTTTKPTFSSLTPTTKISTITTTPSTAMPITTNVPSTPTIIPTTIPIPMISTSTTPSTLLPRTTKISPAITLSTVLPTTTLIFSTTAPTTSMLSPISTSTMTIASTTPSTASTYTTGKSYTTSLFTTDTSKTLPRISRTSSTLPLPTIGSPTEVHDSSSDWADIQSSEASTSSTRSFEKDTKAAVQDISSISTHFITELFSESTSELLMHSSMNDSSFATSLGDAKQVTSAESSDISTNGYMTTSSFVISLSTSKPVTTNSEAATTSFGGSAITMQTNLAAAISPNSLASDKSTADSFTEIHTSNKVSVLAVSYSQSSDRAEGSSSYQREVDTSSMSIGTGKIDLIVATSNGSYCTISYMTFCSVS